MKQIVLIIFMTLNITSLSVQGQGFTITGEIKGVAEGETVTLKQFSDMQPVDVATATVRDSKFTLSGNTPIPEFSQLFVGATGPLQFFVENSNINITVDLENLHQSVVTGSKENELFFEFVGGLTYFAVQMQQANNAFMAARAAGNSSLEAEMGFRAQMEKLTADQTAFRINFGLSNPGRITTAFLAINDFMQIMDLSQLTQIADSFDANAEQSQWVSMLKGYIYSVRRTDVGQMFVDITLKTPDDNSVSISDFAGKGKYVLLDFWAAWCYPCRVANPHLVQIYNRYKNNDFEIVGISLDHTKDAWIKAIADDNLTWPQMSDLGHWNSEAARTYNVRGIPHMILLDKDGKIIARGLSVTTLADRLAEIFEN